MNLTVVQLLILRSALQMSPRLSRPGFDLPLTTKLHNINIFNSQFSYFTSEFLRSSLNSANLRISKSTFDHFLSPSISLTSRAYSLTNVTFHSHIDFPSTTTSVKLTQCTWSNFIASSSSGGCFGFEGSFSAKITSCSFINIIISTVYSTGKGAFMLISDTDDTEFILSNNIMTNISTTNLLNDYIYHAFYVINKGSTTFDQNSMQLMAKKGKYSGLLQSMTTTSILNSNFTDCDCSIGSGLNVEIYDKSMTSISYSLLSNLGGLELLRFSYAEQSVLARTDSQHAFIHIDHVKFYDNNGAFLITLNNRLYGSNGLDSSSKSDFTIKFALSNSQFYGNKNMTYPFYVTIPDVSIFSIEEFTNCISDSDLVVQSQILSAYQYVLKSEWKIVPRPTLPPSPTPTRSPNPTATSTAEPTVTSTPKPTVTPTAEPTVTPTPKPTVTSTPKPTVTSTPKPTVTSTPKPTVTSTPKPTVTSTPKPTVTSTPKPTVTSTPKPTVTSTPKPPATLTPKPPATPTPVPTISSIPNPAATSTPNPTEIQSSIPIELPTEIITPDIDHVDIVKDGDTFTTTKDTSSVVIEGDASINIATAKDIELSSADGSTTSSQINLFGEGIQKIQESQNIELSVKEFKSLTLNILNNEENFKQPGLNLPIVVSEVSNFEINIGDTQRGKDLTNIEIKSIRAPIKTNDHISFISSNSNLDVQNILFSGYPDFSIIKNKKSKKLDQLNQAIISRSKYSSNVKSVLVDENIQAELVNFTIKSNISLGQNSYLNLKQTKVDYRTIIQFEAESFDQVGHIIIDSSKAESLSYNPSLYSFKPHELKVKTFSNSISNNKYPIIKGISEDHCGQMIVSFQPQTNIAGHPYRSSCSDNQLLIYSQPLEQEAGKPNKFNNALIAVIAVGCIVVIASIVALIYYTKRKSRKATFDTSDAFEVSTTHNEVI